MFLKSSRRAILIVSLSCVIVSIVAGLVYGELKTSPELIVSKPVESKQHQPKQHQPKQDPAFPIHIIGAHDEMHP
jgi:hypothetical protein